jgi:hypothetical protein
VRHMDWFEVVSERKGRGIPGRPQRWVQDRTLNRIWIQLNIRLRSNFSLPNGCNDFLFSNSFFRFPR